MPKRFPNNNAMATNQSMLDVKKMLKPFKGLQFDEFLHNEIHLNEIMSREDDQVDPIKESRKRHLRILDAALKEQVVDT